MADIRINDLPLEENPNSSEFLAIDGASTKKATIKKVVDSGAPVASQAEAQAGTDAVKRMTPLTTKQSIASEVGVTLASAANGALASTALQPGEAATPAQGALADSAAQKSQNLADLSNKGTAQDNLQVGAVFADKATAVSATIPTRNRRIRTQCYDGTVAKRRGGANYRESSVSEVANYPSRSWFQSNAGARYWLLDEILPDAYMFGGVGDGVADDAVALQQLCDFWTPAAQMTPGTVTSRPVAMSGGGPVKIPKGVWRHTVTIYTAAFVCVMGDAMAMFPQAPFDTSTYGQYNFPNATVLRPDLPAPDRALGVGLHVSPYVLTLSGASASLTGQTVGTRFKSLQTTNISGFDVDLGCLNYCEGANIQNLTVWPVNEIFSAIRWTAGAKAEISYVGARNCVRGIFNESCWESSIHGCGIFDFKEHGIYGGGNLHAFGIRDNWIHGGGRVLAGDKPVGIYCSSFDGIDISANAIDDLFDAISLQNGCGVTIQGNHSERIKNVYLTGLGVYGVSGRGNHLIQNIFGGYTAGFFDNFITMDGVNCQMELELIVNDTGYGRDLDVGYSYRIGTNPNTGVVTALSYATTDYVGLTYLNVKPKTKDVTRVNRQNGYIQFKDGADTYVVAGSGNGNQYSEIKDVKGDANVTGVVSRKFNGVQKYYEQWTETSLVVKTDTTNVTIAGFDASRFAAIIGGVYATATFGTPETFRDAPAGSLGFDTANFRMFQKTTALGTLTGWEGVQGIQKEVTAANIAAVANAINTAGKYTGRVVWDTTNNRAMRAMGAAAASPWRTFDGLITVTPA